MLKENYKMQKSPKMTILAIFVRIILSSNLKAFYEMQKCLKTTIFNYFCPFLEGLKNQFGNF